MYFELDPATGTSYLVFFPESLRNISNLSVGGQAIEIPETPGEVFSVQINNHDIVELTTKENKTIPFRVDLPLTKDGVVTVSTLADGTVPEPSTLVLLGLGLVGFLGFKRWRKNRKRGQQGIKTLLLLAVIVGMTGVLCGDRIPRTRHRQRSVARSHRLGA